jgi:hypothetical protein
VAQPLALDIRDGLVTLQATNVPVRQVLAEWGRVGGTRIVGADRVTGPPLTLRLEGVPEGKALDIVLRGAAGYVAAARAVPGSGASSYDRILVLASSTPPAGGGSAAAGGARAAAPRPFGVPPVPDASDLVETDADVAMPEPVPDAPPFGPPVANPFGQSLEPQVMPAGGLFTPLPPQAPVATPGFFGVEGSPMPGVVQQPPGTPGAPPRPQ